MGNTQTVAFQLPTSNGPVLRDVEGNEWRYLRYPKETLNPRAHRGDNHGHHSDPCWWYLDRPEEDVRYMVDAEYGCPASTTTPSCAETGRCAATACGTSPPSTRAQRSPMWRPSSANCRTPPTTRTAGTSGSGSAT